MAPAALEKYVSPLMKNVFYSLLVFIALAASPVILVMAAGPASADEDVVVVELFTSQGCVACPPADKVMMKLANEKGIVALSWPVDYWDYLGWKDTFATAANTARQAGYNDAMGKNGVYTPQVVLNGRVQAVGSREGEIRALIERLKADGQLQLEVTLDGDRENLVINVGAGAVGSETSVWLIMYDAEQVVDIQYGDNRGRSLRYAHIVRDSQFLGPWTGNQMRIPIDMERVARVGADCIAVLVQEGKAGPILGAVKLVLSDLD